MKKALSLFLAFLFAVGGVSMAYAEETDAKLYGTYGDGMLFQQNKDAVISIDNIRFAPDTSDGKMQFDPDINTADTIIEKISAIFIKTIGAIISLFR